MPAIAPDVTCQASPVPDWPQRWWQLAHRLARVTDVAGRSQLLARCLSAAQPLALGFVNAHAMNLAARDLAFSRDLAALDVLLRDGIGLALLLRSLGLSPGLNLNGTDLIPQIITACQIAVTETSDAPASACQPGVSAPPLLLLGTTSPWLERARQALYAQGLACEAAHGFLPTTHYLRLARALRPRLIVLGMGMPRQESVALALREALDFPCLIVCGGAIIDFLGGRVRRAPAWVRALRSEWAWRLACEPRRLFVRYVIGNPVFMVRLGRVALCSRHQATACASDTR